MTDKIHPIGRIYRLVSSNGMVYVGSTVRPLKERFYKHKHPAAINCELQTRCLFENGATVCIELIKEFANITTKDLCKLESEYKAEDTSRNSIVVDLVFDAWFDKNIIRIEKGRISSSALLRKYIEDTNSYIMTSKKLNLLMNSKGIASKKISSMYFIGVGMVI